MDRVEEYCGFKFRVLFNRYGYTPHYAEHYSSEGNEKLLMADPHMRRSIIIYDVTRDSVEWEYQVKGTAIQSNPHIARSLPRDVPEVGANNGDIVFADMENKWNIMDRDGTIKYQTTLPTLRWAHDCLLSKAGDGFIVTDYAANFVGKLDFKGRVKWSLKITKPAKLSVVEGATTSGVHSNTHGGDYLLAQNDVPYGVYEIRDEDGSIVRRIPNGPKTLNNFWCHTPHSAFRRGVAEAGGNLTVIGFEAGGGIVAIDQNQRPRWGVMKGFSNIAGTQYIPSRYSLMETTHVFPTLSGGVGAVDWSGKMSSRVIEILGFPRSTLTFLLAWDLDPQKGIFLDPPLDIMEYDNIVITIMNTGEGSVTYSITATTLTFVTQEDQGTYRWNSESTGTVNPKNNAEFELDNTRKKRTFIRVELKRENAGKPVNVTVVASYS